MKKLFVYFMASDFSQSNTFNNQIASLKYIMTMYHDSADIKREIEKALTKLYGAHFDTVSPVVTITYDTENAITLYGINIAAVYNGESFVLDRTINSNLSNIATYETALAELYEQY